MLSSEHSKALETQAAAFAEERKQDVAVVRAALVKQYADINQKACAQAFADVQAAVVQQETALGSMYERIDHIN